MIVILLMDALEMWYKIGAAVPAGKHTPWMMGLYRSLGGGATVMFEHGNPDKAGMKVNQPSSIEN